MDYTKLILGVLIVIVLYIIYRYVFVDSTSSDLVATANAKKKHSPIKAENLSGNPASVNFTFSIWIYVDSWQYKYGKDKVIFRRSNKSGDLSPLLKLDAASNDLHLSVVTYATNNSAGTSDTWTIHNIPLQKWTSIIMSSNNRAIDTYIDGKLVNTHVLSGVPKMDKEAPIDLTPDGGFSGNIAKFKYYSRTIDPREAYKIYKEGPGGNMLTDMLNKYKLKVQFLKDNEEINGFEI